MCVDRMPCSQLLAIIEANFGTCNGFNSIVRGIFADAVGNPADAIDGSSVTRRHRRSSSTLRDILQPAATRARRPSASAGAGSGPVIV